MYFVVIRYSCDVNTLKLVKYVPCWLELLSPHLPLQRQLPVPAKTSPGCFIFAATKKRTEDAAWKGPETSLPICHQLGRAAEGNGEARRGVVVMMHPILAHQAMQIFFPFFLSFPERFFFFYLTAVSWRGFKLFMFTENWKLRSLTF